MIEQLPQAFISHEQFNDTPHQAQLRACPAARAHLPQPTVTPHVRGEAAPKFHQHSDGNDHQREHPRSGCQTTDAGLGKTEQAFRIPKAFCTGDASGVLRSHPVSRQVAVRQQVPDAPSSVAVTPARLHQKDLSRVALAAPDATLGPSALIRPPA